jgi:hypothetical protein
VPTVKVPERHRRALAGLLDLSAERIEKLRADFDASDGKHRTLFGILDAYVAQPADALQALASLQLAVMQFNMSAQDVSESLGGDAEEKEPVNIFPLLQSPRVQILAKALDLRNSYEHILSESRIISDIRPVFPDGEVPEIANAAMVNHTLKLTFFPGERGLPTELHVALDTTDLAKLREQIDRALEKERAARALVEKGGAVVLEPLVKSE